MTDMTDYSDLPTYEKKALLRSSADAVYYRKKLLLFAGAFLLAAALSVVLIADAVRTDRARREANEQWIASLSADARAAYEEDPDRFAKGNEMRRLPFAIAAGVLLTGAAGFFAGKNLRAYLLSVGDADNFEFAEAEFDNPRRKYTERGTIYRFAFSAVLDGQMRRLETRPLFTEHPGDKFNAENYAHHTVLIARNPVRKVTVVIRPL